MATQVTPNSPVAWRPDVIEYVPGDVIPDALILQTALVVGQIEGDAPAVRVPYVLDDGTPGFVAEGAAIPDAAQQFSEVVVHTNKVAIIGKYSYETLQQPEAAKLIVDSLSRSVIRSANAAYLGNAASPAGLLNVSGITDGGDIGTNLDTLVDAVTGIEDVNGMATHIIASPSAWAALSKLKTSSEHETALLGAGVEAGQRQVLGVPVLVTNSMPDDELLVLDKSSVIAAQSPLRLARSDEAYFGNDVVGIKLVWRLGWNVMRPNRVVKMSTATGG